MKEHPIIFSTDMVKAILEGRKTQTRRVIKEQDLLNEAYEIHGDRPSPSMGAYWLIDADSITIQCPYGQVGDRLWVRETWAAQANYNDYPPRDIPPDSVIFYKVNDRLKLLVAEEHRDLGKWKPSIHMPRWASRITLEITGLRVERVQEISIDDVFSEGTPMPCERGDGPWNDPYVLPRFQELWNSINAKRGYSWETNPWVWVLEFKGATNVDG